MAPRGALHTAYIIGRLTVATCYHVKVYTGANVSTHEDHAAVTASFPLVSGGGPLSDRVSLCLLRE